MDWNLSCLQCDKYKKQISLFLIEESGLKLGIVYAESDKLQISLFLIEESGLKLEIWFNANKCYPFLSS